MPIEESELILNSDGSIYHLNLLPEDIADIIITVGDQERVPQVSKYFDTIALKKGKREFITHTGLLKGKRITVISTGIGTDNIDIVMNELDALVNIDFETRQVKSKKTVLKIIRIGTSGAIQKDIPVGSFILSEMAVGLDALLHFYKNGVQENKAFRQALSNHLGWISKHIEPYVFSCDKNMANSLMSNRIRLGTTLTNAGFYAPQGRQLRLKSSLPNFHERISTFQFMHRQITNLEMETSALYGLSRLMGHSAVSMNAILANRATGEFSKDTKQPVDELIQYCLERLV
ncbi:MAG: nucleoside phosphorylase [Croceitalea sp.]|nr:nucleoside phosphorylase [Croceitalea sp.]